MLSQKDVCRLIAKDVHNIPQHIVYQILAAYVYSKASRGNLPGEVISKVLSVQRKLNLLTNIQFSTSSPISRAFEAIKAALLQANRKWMTLGPLCFGSLGQIGAASSEDSKWAWTKATDGQVKEFASEGVGMEVDAGRVIGPGSRSRRTAGEEEEGDPWDGPPTYVPPTPADENGPDGPLGNGAQATTNQRTAEQEAMEQARLKLAEMREQRLRMEQEQEERRIRIEQAERADAS